MNTHTNIEDINEQHMSYEDLYEDVERLARECAEAAFNEGATGPFDAILWGDEELLAKEVKKEDLSEEAWHRATTLFINKFNDALAELCGKDDELTPKELAYGWALSDSSNQLWWPADHVQLAILASADPEEAILRLYNDGAEGEWCS